MQKAARHIINKFVHRLLAKTITPTIKVRRASGPMVCIHCICRNDDDDDDDDGWDLTQHLKDEEEAEEEKKKEDEHEDLSLIHI